MKYFALLAALAGLFAATSPNTLEAQERIRCESSNNRLENCRIPNLDQFSVRMVQQMSGAACVNGQSWGTEEGLIWVDRGCRAVFEYETRGSSSQADDNRPRQQITCSSNNNRRSECPIRNLDLSSVDLEETISGSPCIRGTSWGTGRNSSGSRLFIWVSGGCRGRFSYRTNSSTGSGSGYEAPRTAEQLASLNGGQASSVDGNLRQWGFRDVDGFSVGNTLYTIWYNRATRQCVQMTTADGRAVDVRDIQTHDRCR